MRKIVSVISILIVVVSSLLLTGCGQETASNKKVDIFFPSGNERFVTSGNSLKDTLEKEGFTVSLQFAGSNDEQAQQIDAVLGKGSGCIVIAAFDSKAIGTSLEKAKAKNIPIIAYDRLPMDTEAVDYYATFDNEGIGTAMAKYVENKFNLKQGAGPYTVEFFQGSDDDNNAVLINKGMMAVLKPYIDKGQLVVASGQTGFRDTTIKSWDGKNAAARMDKLVKTYYTGRNLDILMSASDSIAEGLVDGLAGAGYNGVQPFITGQDATPKALEFVRSGKQGTTMAKSAELLNGKCIRMIKAVVEGTQPEVNDVSTYNNGKITVPSYLCIPLILDKENLDEAVK